MEFQTEEAFYVRRGCFCGTWQNVTSAARKLINLTLAQYEPKASSPESFPCRSSNVTRNLNISHTFRDKTGGQSEWTSLCDFKPITPCNMPKLRKDSKMVVRRQKQFWVSCILQLKVFLLMVFLWDAVCLSNSDSVERHDYETMHRKHCVRKHS
jgi:hypothetical protein